METNANKQTDKRFADKGNSMKFPIEQCQRFADALYKDAHQGRMAFYDTLSRNLWEGYVNFDGRTSGYNLIVYTGPNLFGF
mgnify:CR=1 FL=1